MTGREPQNRFVRRERLGQGSVRAVVFIFVALVATIGWLYIFLASEAFSVSAIEVRGVVSLDAEEVKRQTYDVLDERRRPFWQPARHGLLLDTAALEETLQEKLFARSVTIEKPSFGILRLIIQEQTKKLIVHTPKKFFWLDIKGNILGTLNLHETREATLRLAGKVPSSLNQPPIFFLPDELALNQGIPIPQIRSWLNTGLRMQAHAINYREITPSTSSSSRIVVLIARGHNVWFDAAENLDQQILAYKLFENDQSKNLKIYEYVDARIPGRLYVK